MSSWWRKLCIGSFGKVPEPKSYEQVSLFKLTLPWLRFKWGPTINVCGGGYVAGKTKRSGDWGREEHIRVHLNIERQQFSQPTKELTNTRPRGLWIWYTSYNIQSSIQILKKKFKSISKNDLIWKSINKYCPLVTYFCLLKGYRWKEENFWTNCLSSMCLLFICYTKYH